MAMRGKTPKAAAEPAADDPRPDLAEARLEFTSRLASFGLGEEPEPILEDAPPPRPSGTWQVPPGCL